MEDPSLENTWTLYAHLDTNVYADGIKKMHEFSTVQGFWCMFNHIPDISECFTNRTKLEIQGVRVNAFSLFKGDVTPEWEHEVNRTGGSGSSKLSQKKTFTRCGKRCVYA